MHHSTLLLPLFSFLVGGCTMPQFVAKKGVDMTIPASALRKLQCDSHNGTIKVTGEAGRTEISLHAELSVRGHTQQEADDNLVMLELCQEQEGDSLHLYGKHPERWDGDLSPAFGFVLSVPENMALMLTSHNGDLVVNGTHGDARLETHNGDIEGAVVSHHLDATSHNGRVHLHIAGESGAEDSVDGTVISHNGNIDLAFDAHVSTTLDASSHNGSVTAPAALTNVHLERSSLSGRLGTGAGHLTVTTHNGDVVLR